MHFLNLRAPKYLLFYALIVKALYARHLGIYPKHNA